jgi:CHASE1-domain containing sensor protein
VEQAKALIILKEKFNLLTFGVSALLALLGIFCLFAPFLKRGFVIIAGRPSETCKTFILPTIAAALVLLFSISLSYIASGVINQETEAEFHAEANRITEVVIDRLGLYANVLRGGRGLFDASTEVSRSEWKAYTESLALQKDYPGIQGFGFSKVIQPEEKDVFVKSIQKEGFSQFDITPVGKRDIYTSIIYLEPFDMRNQRAFGYDMFSEQNRHEAMVYARDTGDISVSKKVTLLQENSSDKQAGFLMYEAVYRPKGTIYGYVYAPFRMNNFMSGIFFSEGSTKIKVEIFDGADIDNLSEERLMYQNNVEVLHSLYTSVETIPVYNQSWTIRFSVPEGYGYDVVRGSMPALIMIFGTLLSILMFFVVYVVNTRRARAVSLAKVMTSDLERSKKEVEEKAKIAEQLNAVMVDRELKMVEMKKEIKKLRYEK